MSARTALILAIVIALLHAGLSGYYAQITPYRQSGIALGQRGPDGHPARLPDVGAPDERQHANYVQRLLDGKGFPILGDPAEDASENYQAHQPPLYYLLGAGWSKLVGAVPNDPEKGRSLRWLNSLIGASTVLGVYFLAVWGLKKPEVGVVAAAFVALLPMNAALSGAVSNDPLLYALCTWTLAVMARALREGWNWQRAILVAVFTGAAFLTKTTAVALLPVLLFAALIKQPKRPSLAMAGTVALVAIAIASPWWIRNQRLYGDPLAMGAFQKAFTGNPTPDTFIQPLQEIGQSPTQAKMTYWGEGVGWWTARSFFGTFGYMDIWLNENGRSDTFPAVFSKKSPQPNAIYRVLVAVMFLIFVGWLWASFTGAYKDASAVQLLNVVFAVVVVALFLRFNMQYFQGQARYLFPALGPIGVGVGIGLLQLLRGKVVPALAGLAVLLIALNVFALARLPGEFALRTESVSQTSGT